MTKEQALTQLNDASAKCAQYLQLKLQAGDHRGAISVLLELAELKAQIAAVAAEFEPAQAEKPAEAQS